MAITFIYPVKVTGEKSLNYDTENKNAEIIQNKNDSKNALDYIMRDKKGNTYKLSADYIQKMKNYISYDENKNIIFHTVTSGLHCCVENAHKEWELVRQNSNNRRSDSGNLQYCIIQNFGIDLDPMIANKIGVEFAQKYLADYQCVVSTHINTGYVHNHIEFNATSFVTGKKFNDNLKAIRDIRQVSDELCKQYELEVLEHTKDFNYIMYKDTNGKIKVYEPTERKNQILEGEFANKNDYRNTGQFKQSVEYKDTHLDELRKDIERLLPYTVSYEDLLQQLRNVGYEIKEKTKNGEWRKYVSFKAPTWDKFVRDKSLGEEYERENLKKTIEKQKSKIVNYQENKMDDDIKRSDIYVYGRIVIEDIDDNYRYKKKKNTYEKVNRNEIEKYIIADVKRLNKEMNRVKYKATFKPLEHHVQELAEGTKKEQYLIDRINSNLRTLRFVEDREIKSFEQINDVVKMLYEKRKACHNQLDLIEKALRRANADIVLIDKYNTIKNMISDNGNNPNYAAYEKNNDLDLFKSYESILKEKGLLSEERQLEFKEKYAKYNNSYLQLVQALEKINDDIREYDDCIFNISTVDKNNGNRYISQIETYYNTKNSYNRNVNERQ